MLRFGRGSTLNDPTPEPVSGPERALTDISDAAQSL
jgi:hypothetical protein